MNIVAINGSPKNDQSVSGLLIRLLQDHTHANIVTYQARRLSTLHDLSPVVEDIAAADVLLVVFPLYVDSLPAPLIKSLTLIQTALGERATKPSVKVYAVCNCGFYEARQTGLALQMVEQFAVRCGFTWGYGLGIGCGGMLLGFADDMSKGPTANVDAALRELAESLQSSDIRSENQFVIPRFPRLLYQLGGNIGWLQMARANRLRGSLKAQPHQTGSLTG